MKRKGFTLVELIIILAMIAFLAAIVIPGFMDAQKKAKAKQEGNQTEVQVQHVGGVIHPVGSGPSVSSISLIIDLSMPGAEASIEKVLKENGVDPGSVIGISKVGSYDKAKIFYLKAN